MSIIDIFPSFVLRLFAQAITKLSGVILKARFLYSIPVIGKQLNKKYSKSKFRDWLQIVLRGPISHKEFIVSWRLLTDKNLRKRKKLLAEVKDASSTYQVEDGFLKVNKEVFSEIPRLAEVCKEIIKEKGYDRSSIGNHDKSNIKKLSHLTKASYFTDILTLEDLYKHPEIMEFALSKKFASIAFKHLEYLPQLTSVGLKISPVNDTQKGSPNFHFDSRAGHIKCFINIFDVSEEGGPFTFLDKKKTNEFVDEHESYSDRKMDLEKLLEYEKNFARNSSGPSGSGIICETSECIHYGGRVKDQTRVMLSLHYCDYMSCFWHPSKGIFSEIWIKDFPELREHFSQDEFSRELLRLDHF